MNRYLKISILVIFIIVVWQILSVNRTRDGKLYEKFRPAVTEELPDILRNYMRQHYIPYSYYILPNYVVDFMKYDKDFTMQYNSGKYVVVVFTKERSKSGEQTLKLFYSKLNSLLTEYENKYILVEKNEVTPSHYALDFDEHGYNDLRKRCKNFCLINTKNNTMFTFSRITDSEIDAIELLFQQYNTLLDK